MTRESSHAGKVSDLLAQDAVLAAFSFDEFRMKLDVEIQSLERRARVMRGAAWCGLAVTVACMLGAPLLLAVGFGDRSWAPFIWAATGQTALLATGLFAAVYSIRYRPALLRAKDSLQARTIAELSRRVDEIAAKLEERQ